MSTIIQIKYSDSNAQPANDALAKSELAYSFVSSGRKLYIGEDQSGTIVPIAIGGEYFTEMLDHTKGTLTASSAIITDSNNKIDVLNVDNLTLDGNTLSSTDTNGDITVDPNGTGEINLSANTNITGNLTVSGTQSFTGQTTLASVNVTDLTDGRLVLAGTSGELEDHAGLTYSSSTAADIDIDISGSLSVDGIDIDGQTIGVSVTNGDLTLNPNGNGLVNFGGSRGIKVPQGATGDRPTGADGIIRYNTTKTQYEGYSNGAWRGLGGVIDADQDTYVTAEQSADDDTLRLYSAGVEIATVSNANGVVVAGTHGLDVDGGITVDNIDIDGDTITINGSTIQGTGSAAAGTIILDPAPAAGDNGGNLIVRGNLQVTGTQTIVNSTVVTVDDPIMVLGQDNIGDSLDRGIQVLYNTASPVAATSLVNGVEYTIVSAGDTDFTAVGAADSNVGTVFTATGSGTGTGTAVTTSTEVTGFFGYDRGVDQAFTWIEDSNVTNPVPGDARFMDLKLSGSIVEVDGVAPTNGQLLIGNTANGDMELATLTAGDSITITNSAGGIEIDVNAAAAVATTDITDTGDGVTDYSPASANAGSRGAATFASEQFNVNSGHVVITRIEGGQF